MKEDPQEFLARLEDQAQELTAILAEWPLVRRLKDQAGYISALKTWHQKWYPKEKP